MASATLSRTISRSSEDLPWFHDFIQASPTDDNKNRAFNLLQEGNTRNLLVGQISYNGADFPYENSVSNLVITNLSITKTLDIHDLSLVQNWSDTDASANWQVYRDLQYTFSQSTAPEHSDDFIFYKDYYNNFYAQPGYSITYSQTVTP